MSENDVRWNLEQTINKTLQSKWNVTMGNISKKSLFPSSIYNSNYDLTDNTSNDFQSVENRNAIASNPAFIDVNGAASLEMLQSIAMQSNEKSISIKNRCDGYPASSNLRLAGNKRQPNNSDGIRPQSCSLDNGQRRRRLNNTKMTRASVPPMKTQCETLCEYFVLGTNANPFNNSTFVCIV